MNIADWKTLPPEVKDIFKKYRIISEQDREVNGKTVREVGYTMARLYRARDTEGRVLGSGPLLHQDVLARFLKADASPKHQWLDWMLNQCGGGQEGLRRTAQAMEQVRERFIEERVRGYRDMNGKYHNPTTKAEAEERWALSHGRFGTVLEVADQDLVEKLHVFGFHRNWPGLNNAYEKCVKAVSEFVALMPKTCEMNDFMAKQGMREKMIKLTSEDYATTEALQAAVSKVERFFAALAARKDIQVEKIYEDDYLSVICPLTYASAVRYGWDGWPFANRDNFEANLERDSSAWQDAWKTITGKDEKVIVYIQFHVAVPSWVSYEKNKFHRHTLQNIAVTFPKKAMRRLSVDEHAVLDEENRPNRNMASIRADILNEPTRDDNPENEEYPVLRGPRVLTTEKEAQRVIDHLNKAHARIEEWAAGFDFKRIVSDYMPTSDS